MSWPTEDHLNFNELTLGRGKEKKNQTNRAPGDKNRWPGAALGDIAIINHMRTHGHTMNT